MKTQTKMKVLAAATLLALLPAYADDTSGASALDTQVKVLDNTGASRGQAQVAARIAAMFRSIAGSDANALALVNGLRSGTAITLTSPAPTTTTTTTITPPTKPMGWGNVRIALALAQAELQQAGITKPTAAQLQAALTGGTLTSPAGTTTQVQGVLTLRASGMGWGQIANAQGTRLGPVLAGLRQTQSQVAKLPVDGGEHEHETEHGGKGSSKTAASTTTTRTASTTSSGGQSPKTTVTTANGTSTSSQGHGSKGLTTASGSTSSTPAAGKGIVTAAGGAAGSVAASAKPHSGSGVVTGTGAGSGTTAAGVTTAHGNDAGSGHGGGNGKGKGG